MSQRTLRSLVLSLVALAASACAAAAPPITATPADIPRLERALAEVPGSADTLTLLGVAYQAAGRHEDAVRTLERATALPDAPGVAWLYLGLSQESLERWQEARDAYVAFLATGTGAGDLREDVQRRVALADRELLEVEARRMLDQEETLSGLPPEPRSVAVFPFRVSTSDPRFAPLQLALADMVVTDLDIPGVLVLLERAQISAVVREMALDLAGIAEPGTGARVGRLMRAQHVIQGSVALLDEQTVRLDLAVVDAATRLRTGGASSEGALERIFDAEKAAVFALLDALGVTLTPAERERIEDNRAANLIAFLAYGEGLMAMENGDYAGAIAAFASAAQADPGFTPAAAAQAEAAELQQAAQTSTEEIALEAVPELPAAPIDDLDPRRNALNDVVDRTNPNPGTQYTGDDTDPEIATNGLGDDDTSDDSDDSLIGVPPTAIIDIPIDNPTRP